MEKGIKGVLVFLATILAASFRAIIVPFALLVLFNGIDYITGLIAAPKRGQKLSSYKSFRGIAKKICMWLLIVVSVGIDILIVYLCETAGWNWPFSFAVGCLSCVWLVANEVISIIENISDMGGAVPPFLLPLVKWVKTQAEGKASMDNIDKLNE